MRNRRMPTGRMARVEQRKRTTRLFIVAGVIVAVVIALVIIAVVAIHYKNKVIRKSETDANIEEIAEEELPIENTEELEATIPTYKPRLKILNSTSVPQRFGNAKTAIENYNEKNKSVFEIDTASPKIKYSKETRILYHKGFGVNAAEIGAEMKNKSGISQGKDFPRIEINITIIVGQDYSEFIGPALVKQGELEEEVRVEVLNGCGIDGAAGKIKEVLENNGYSVVSVGNADNFDYKNTHLLVPIGRESDSLEFIDLLGLSKESIIEPDYDIKVIIGDDF